MGLLDDAIREHLELKRRHGADPGEVARQEREVLGGPRSPVAAPADEGSESAAAEPAPPASEPAAEPPSPPSSAPELEEPRGGVSADRFAPDPELDWSDPAPPGPQDEPEAAAEEDDVLEETPDFLQETPEHDRLWFEQRPPRDFDF